MIIYSEKEFRTGGRRAKPVIRATSDDVEEFDEVLMGIQERVPSQSWIFRPLGADRDYRAKARPYLMIEKQHLRMLESQDAFAVPDSVVSWVMWQTKIAIWMREVPGASTKSGEKRVRQYLDAKTRALTREILITGAYDSLVARRSRDSSQFGVKTLISRVEKIDLGRGTALNWVNYRDLMDERLEKMDLEDEEGDDMEYTPSYPSLIRDYWAAEPREKLVMTSDETDGSYLRYLIGVHGTTPPEGL